MKRRTAILVAGLVGLGLIGGGFAAGWLAQAAIGDGAASATLPDWVAESGTYTPITYPPPRAADAAEYCLQPGSTSAIYHDERYLYAVAHAAGVSRPLYEAEALSGWISIHPTLWEEACNRYFEDHSTSAKADPLVWQSEVIQAVVSAHGEESKGWIETRLTDPEQVYCFQNIAEVTAAARSLGLLPVDSSGGLFDYWVTLRPHEFVRACQATFESSR